MCGIQEVISSILILSSILIQGFDYGSRTHKKWKGKIEVNGITEDKKIVVSGYSVFKFMETKGLPLDFMFMYLDKDEYVVDWLEFVQTSLEHNWNIRGTLTKLENSLIDVYGRCEYSETVIKRLNDYFINTS